MAGDWIKVEQATLHKTEVLRVAELLGISRRECVGLMLDFWCWLDNNTRTDSVPNLSRLCLDSVLNCPGFSAAMECVGWIKWDDKNASATIVNYSHHNGESAKSRAYEQKKKRQQREKLSRICPDETGTREEKRRDISTSVDIERKQKKPRLQEPTLEHRTLAAQLGVDCSAEFAKYRDHFAASGKPHKDEVAGFRNWLRRAAEYRRPTKNRNIDILTGRVPHAIEGIAERVDCPTVLPFPRDLREPYGDDVEGGGPERSAASVG